VGSSRRPPSAPPGVASRKRIPAPPLDALPSLITFCAALASLAAAPALAQQWKPSRNVELIVASGAGGAADRQGRTVQKYLQSFPGIPSVTVSNRAGGGGNLAYTFLAQHPGEAHYIGTMATSLLTNQITGVAQNGYQDLTPLNILIREYVAAWVRNESAIGSARELIAALRKNPAAVSFAFATARGNQNHIVIGMIARAAGVDPKALKTVVYASGGQGMIAALGGHVDVWVGTAGSAQIHQQNGTIRVLGISSTQRQEGRMAAMPTLREHGIDAVYYAWRGFAGPKGLSAAQTAFWDQAFARVVQAEEWKKELEDNAWADGFMGAAETRKHLDAEYELLRKMLADLGVAAR
jgi:putative tricarboxylic transport membrane protein